MKSTREGEMESGKAIDTDWSIDMHCVYTTLLACSVGWCHIGGSWDQYEAADVHYYSTQYSISYGSDIIWFLLLVGCHHYTIIEDQIITLILFE